MNIPQTIAFATSATTAQFFLPNVLQPTLVKNILIHNEGAGNQTITLTYRVGISDTVGVGTNYDFYSPTVAAKTSDVFRDLIVVNPGDSLGVYTDGSNANIIANVIPL